MRVGIVGYGLAGRVFHGRLLADSNDAEVVAVVTRDTGRREQVRSDFPRAACFDTVEEMLASTVLDLAVVATATPDHPAAALACLAARVATVVDKPLAADAEHGRRIVEAAGDTPLTVFQNRRWDADQLTLRRLLSEERLGRVLRYESRLERWRPQVDPGRWRERTSAEQGGGVLADLASHLVDQALMLFGPARAVYAEVATVRAPAGAGAGGGLPDDDAFVALEHDGGTRSHLWCSSVTPAAGPRLRVQGSVAGFVVEEVDGQEEALRAGKPVAEAVPQSSWLVRGAEREAVDPSRGRWDGFYPALFVALRDGAPMPVDPMDSLRALEVIDAARRSAASGQVVRFD
jgi:predicted dehydrogenase